MSLVLLKKRLKRKWLHWIDPEFDGDKYAERITITVDDSDYYELDKKIVNGNIYSLLVNEDDENDYFIRKLVIEEGTEYYVGLEDEVEFYKAVYGFVSGTTDIGFLRELREELSANRAEKGGKRR